MLAVIIYIVAQFVSMLPVVIFPRLLGWSHDHATEWLNTVGAQFWYVLFAEAVTVGCVWWFLRSQNKSMRLIGWRWPRWPDFAKAIAGYFVYLVIFLIVAAVAIQLIPALNADQKQQLGFDNPAGTISLVLTFISLVVLPPIAEETLFRGLVYTGMRSKLRFIPAAILTSLIFSSAHLQLGSGAPPLWTAALDTFILSLVLCYLREKTGSLWAGIFVHAGKNSVAFWVLYLVPLLHIHWINLV